MVQAAPAGIEDDMAAAGLSGSRSPTPEAAPQNIPSMNSKQDAGHMAVVSFVASINAIGYWHLECMSR